MKLFALFSLAIVFATVGVYAPPNFNPNFRSQHGQRVYKPKGYQKVVDSIKSKMIADAKKKSSNDLTFAPSNLAKNKPAFKAPKIMFSGKAFEEIEMKKFEGLEEIIADPEVTSVRRLDMPEVNMLRNQSFEFLNEDELRELAADPHVRAVYQLSTTTAPVIATTEGKLAGKAFSKPRLSPPSENSLPRRSLPMFRGKTQLGFGGGMISNGNYQPAVSGKMGFVGGFGGGCGTSCCCTQMPCSCGTEIVVKPQPVPVPISVPFPVPSPPVVIEKELPLVTPPVEIIEAPAVTTTQVVVKEVIMTPVTVVEPVGRAIGAETFVRILPLSAAGIAPITTVLPNLALMSQIPMCVPLGPQLGFFNSILAQGLWNNMLPNNYNILFGSLGLEGQRKCRIALQLAAGACQAYDFKGGPGGDDWILDEVAPMECPTDLQLPVCSFGDF